MYECLCVRANHVCLGALVVANMGPECTVHVRSHHDRHSDLHMCDLQCIHILHFTFTLMAHCTSGAIRGSVSCSRTLRQGIELAAFCLLNDLSTSCTTVAPKHTHTRRHTHTQPGLSVLTHLYGHTHTHTHTKNTHIHTQKHMK